MVYEIVLPKLGVSNEEGTLVEWHKKEGDSVKEGEEVFLVETEKTTMEVPSTVTGRIVKILYPPGTTLKAGQVVALAALLGEEVTDGQIKELVSKLGAKESAPIAPIPTTQMAEAKQPAEQAKPESAARASPSARRLMREHSLTPEHVTGSGPGGLITADDVEKAVEAISSFKVSSTIELAGRRLTIARGLSQSGVVPVTLMTDANVKALVEGRAKASVDGKRPSITVLLVPLVARVLKLYPSVNAIFENEKIKIIENINIGVAVDTPDGLIVPVLKNADRMSIREVMGTLEALAEKARAGTLSLAELTLGTFTITNLGMLGVKSFTPVVNPPQSAILGVGIVEERPIVREGKVEVGYMTTLSLTFDHRVMDGAAAARFLKSLMEIVETASFNE